MSTRIKSHDEKLERSYALADAMQAARQPLFPALRLGDIIDALHLVKPESRVEFDFGGLEPTGVDSYRGYYSDLALGFGEDGKNAGDLLSELTSADGAVFKGYKGGEYRMNRDTPVWVANYGDSHGVAVVAVEDQDWRVQLRTQLID
jgi:hypothetical protein